MLKGPGKWMLRLAVLAVLAVLASAVTRIIGARSRRSAPAGRLVIAGDTWPPVPIKPARLREND